MILPLLLISLSLGISQEHFCVSVAPFLPVVPISVSRSSSVPQSIINPAFVLHTQYPQLKSLAPQVFLICPLTPCHSPFSRRLSFVSALLLSFSCYSELFIHQDFRLCCWLFLQDEYCSLVLIQFLYFLTTEVPKTHHVPSKFLLNRIGLSRIVRMH